MIDHPRTIQETAAILDLAAEQCLRLVKEKIADMIVEELTADFEQRIRRNTEMALAQMTISQCAQANILSQGFELHHIIHWEKNKESIKKRVNYKPEIVEIQEES